MSKCHIVGNLVWRLKIFMTPSTLDLGCCLFKAVFCCCLLIVDARSECVCGLCVESLVLSCGSCALSSFAIILLRKRELVALL